MKKADIAVSAFFAVIILAFTAASIFNPVREASESENRKLAQMPEFSAKALIDGTFEKGYEDFVTDQFVWRDGWINIKSQIERSFGRTSSNGIYFAADGYYIERKTASDVDAAQLDRNIGFLTQFVSEMKSLGVNNVYAALAPVASMIHDDKLPPFADEFDWDEISDNAAAKLEDNYIDLRPSLRGHKEEYIYYRTDHHWTTDGAYYAYCDIIKSFGFEPLEKEKFVREEVASDFLGTTIAKLNIKTEPDSICRYIPKDAGSVQLTYNLGESERSSFYNDDKLKTRDKYAYFLGGNDALIEIGTEIKNGRKLLIAKDSYANCLLPFLACHFEKIYVVDLRYFNMGLVTYAEKLENVTDALVLYNISGFSSDRYVVKLCK